MRRHAWADRFRYRNDHWSHAALWLGPFLIQITDGPTEGWRTRVRIGRLVVEVAW